MTPIAQDLPPGKNWLFDRLGRFYDSPRTMLERRLREHQERTALLTFVRDHVVPDAVYRLDPLDLKMIGVRPDGGRGR